MRVLLIILWLIALPLNAQVFKHIDADGKTHYSSTPRNLTGNSPLKLAPLNRQPALIITPPASTQQLLPEKEPYPSHAPYKTLFINGLPSDQALRANNGTFALQINIAPPLHSQHRLQWMLDDQAYGQPSSSLDLHLVNIDRGEHRLLVNVLEGNVVVQQSPVLRFYLQRFHQR